MNNHLIITILIFLIGNIYITKAQTTNFEDEIQHPDYPFMETNFVKEYEPVLKNWLDFYVINLSKFRLKEVTKIDLSKPDDALSIYYEKFNPELCEKYTPELRDYSPNKERYIDMFERRSIFEKKADGKWHYEGSDDCQEIRFIDCANKLNKMISFRGISSIADAAFWVNDTVFCIVSFEDDEKYYINVYNLNDHTETLYYYLNKSDKNIPESYFIYNLKMRGIIVD